MNIEQVVTQMKDSVTEELFIRLNVACDIIEEMSRCFERTMERGAPNDAWVKENYAAIDRADAFIKKQRRAEI